MYSLFVLWITFKYAAETQTLRSLIMNVHYIEFNSIIFGFLAQVSFYWYALFTLLLTTAIALPASEIVRYFSHEERDKEVDPVLLLSYFR